MTIYGYRCAEDGDVEVVRPIGTAPDVVACPLCDRPALRVLHAPLVSRASAFARRALDRAERSRHAPDVVSVLPGAPARSPARQAHPATSRLPRP